MLFQVQAFKVFVCSLYDSAITTKGLIIHNKHMVSLLLFFSSYYAECIIFAIDKHIHSKSMQQLLC